MIPPTTCTCCQHWPFSHLLPVPEPLLVPTASAQCHPQLPLRASVPPSVLLRGNWGRQLPLASAASNSPTCTCCQPLLKPTDSASPTRTCCWCWPKSLCTVSGWERGRYCQCMGTAVVEAGLPADRALGLWQERPGRGSEAGPRLAPVPITTL